MLRRLGSRLRRFTFGVPAPRLASLALLILRLGVGVPMIFLHGLPKLRGYGEMVGSFPNPIGVGPGASLISTIFAEVFCSVALVFGLATRLATIPLITTMSVVIFIVQWPDPFAGKELAILYLSAYAVLLLLGPGAYSVDRLLRLECHAD